MKPFFIIFIILSPVFANAEQSTPDPSIPPIVNPGSYGNPDRVGKPPSDAIVLFDGAILINGKAPRVEK
jgi:hypothetical protein